MQDLALYQRINDMSEYLFPVVERFPKHEKFALCTQIKNCVHDLIRCVIRMQKSRDKKRWLFEADTELEMLRHFIRHAHARRYLNSNKLQIVTKQISEIGRILGGLIKKNLGARS